MTNETANIQRKIMKSFFSLDITENSYDNNIKYFEEIRQCVKEKFTYIFIPKMKKNIAEENIEEQFVLLEDYINELNKLKNEIDRQIIRFKSYNNISQNEINEIFEMKEILYKQVIIIMHNDIMQKSEVLSDEETIASLYADFFSYVNFMRCNIDVKRKKGQYIKKFFWNLCSNICALAGNHKYDYYKNEFILPNNKHNFFTECFQADFSKCIFYKRKRRGYSQAKLSDLSGVDRTMIGKIEKLNQSASLDTVIRLLSVFDLGIMIYPKFCIEKKD